MSNKNDVREIHGDEFADELAKVASEEYHDGEEQYDDESTEELAAPRSVRQILFDILSSRMAFWMGGFVDGLIVGLVIYYIRG